MKHRPSEWKPIADELTEQALEAATAIGDALLAPPEGPCNGTLASGAAGEALLFAYLDCALPGQGYGAIARERMQAGLSAVEDGSLPPELFEGYVGVAFAAQHLSEWLIDLEPEALDPVDDALIAMLDAPPGGEFDLIFGMVGIGVYALERGRRGRGRELLERVIEVLGETAERRDRQVTWLQAPTRFRGVDRERCPNGRYNLGLAYGVSGCIGFLAEAMAAGAKSDLCELLLQGVLAWLDDQRLPLGEASIYPPYVASGLTPRASPDIWAYGDASIALVTYAAGKASNRKAWEEQALALVRKSIQRRDGTFGIADAEIYNGAAGLCHVYNRLYQATGDTAIRDAAKKWLGRALSMRKGTGGVGGFSSFLNDVQRWAPVRGIQKGAAGTALVLLAAASDKEPRWDRMLLTRLQGAGRGA